MQEDLCWGSIKMTKKSHDSEEDNWGWQWQEILSTVSFLTKIGKMQSAGCLLYNEVKE